MLTSVRKVGCQGVEVRPIGRKFTGVTSTQNEWYDHCTVPVPVTKRCQGSYNLVGYLPFLEE